MAHKNNGSGNMPFTQQKRYDYGGNDTQPSTAIPNTFPELERYERRARKVEDIGEMNMSVPTTMTFTSTTRKAD